MAKVFVVASGLALVLVPGANADVVMDQIGPTSAFVTPGTVFASQSFEAAFAGFRVGVIDDFTIGATTKLTEVDAALAGFNGFTAASYGAITAWDVQFYTSVAAAAASLTGNAASQIVAPGAVTLTTPFLAADPRSALATIPINVTLNPGKYWVAVIPELAFGTNGAQIGVYSSNYVAGGPNGSNAVQVNPGGGFGFPGNQSALGINAAYRLIGTAAAVPEPSLPVLASVGLVAAFIARRWTRKNAA
jgi:hypothetical protein